MIILDAGHGWHNGRGDPGAIGPTGLKESDVTLLVATRMAGRLQEAGHQVLLTRPGRGFVSLSDRIRTANAAGADALVSIHCNAAHGSEVGGSETLYYPGSVQGERLARELQWWLVHMGGLRDRGLKPRGDLAVLRNTKMPAVLVELAFISNPVEERLLAHPGWLSGVARGLADAIDLWWKRRDDNTPEPPNAHAN